MRNKTFIKWIGWAVVVVGILPMVRADVYVWLDQTSIKHISNVKPKWWTDDMDQLDPGTVVAPVDERITLGVFIGDTENKKFHWPLCEQIYNQQGLLAIPEHKRVWFKTFEEAIAQGYYACDHCKPSPDGPDYKPKTP
ncbi:hypothetical protein JXA80_09275 [bacterium]|nr:hypothetical protein [candidate division CSSED10-310 bacterium]